MEKVISIVALLLLLTSCNNKRENSANSLQSQEFSYSINILNGSKDVESLFGGRCVFLCDTVTPRELTIRLSHSNIVEKKRPGEVFFLVAYRFFRNLKEDKSNYDKINVVLVYSNNDEAIYDFPTKDLEIVDEKMPLVNKTIELMQQGKYEEIKGLLNYKVLNDTLIPGYSRNQMISDLEKMDSIHGKVISFFPYQFFLEKFEGQQILKLYGSVQRAEQSNDFSICIDARKSSNKIYLLKNKFIGQEDIKYKILKSGSSKGL